eukprot:1357300-Prymnesium_polylepis.1
MRHQTGENKKRFVDLADGFDVRPRPTPARTGRTGRGTRTPVHPRAARLSLSGRCSGGAAWRGVAWRGAAWRGVARRDAAWPCDEWRAACGAWPVAARPDVHLVTRGRDVCAGDRPDGPLPQPAVRGRAILRDAPREVRAHAKLPRGESEREGTEG